MENVGGIDMEINYNIVKQDHIHCGKCYVPINQGEPIYRGLCVSYWIKFANGEK